MKKRFLLFTGMLLACTMMLNAQGGGGGFQRRTVEERVKMTHQRMDSAFKLDAAKLAQVDSAFATFYRTTDKIREDIMASGGDRQGMREKIQPYADERDKKLHEILGDDNYKKWKDEIEPSMRRPGGNRQN